MGNSPYVSLHISALDRFFFLSVGRSEAIGFLNTDSTSARSVTRDRPRRVFKFSFDFYLRYVSISNFSKLTIENRKRDVADHRYPCSELVSLHYADRAKNISVNRYSRGMRRTEKHKGISVPFWKPSHYLTAARGSCGLHFTIIIIIIFLLYLSSLCVSLFT